MFVSLIACLSFYVQWNIQAQQVDYLDVAGLEGPGGGQQEPVPVVRGLSQNGMQIFQP